MQPVLVKAFQFFIFSSLFISLCAVLMVYQTHWLLLHSAPAIGFTGFVFFSTICSYNFHWYLTPYSITSSQRIQWAQKNKDAHLILYFIGFIGSAICFFTIKQHWLALAFGAFVTFLYSAPKLPLSFFKELKKIAVGKTIFLTFVWTYVTTILPVLVANQSLHTVDILFATSRFFLIYSICILFDYRDREDDKKDGIKSIITYLDEKGINYLFFVSLILFVITTVLLQFYNFSTGNICLLLLPGLLTASLYKYAKNNFSDYFYYFVLDGLMMFSGLLMLLGKI